ncbi:MAG: MarR family winged helix-turn-helix transcriptional regulator [Bosea sp. (in: a-proteobacteria)]|jgi:DNA-binding MarR family transcriptional regulator
MMEAPVARGKVEAHTENEPAVRAGGTVPEALPYELIELFFFAYRDFVSDPDRILAELDFGRAHHRVLHFVNRNPGLTIAELLDILKITKQSLNRVLKELVSTAFIEVRTGQADRRQRHLHATASGHALAARLAGVQGERIRQALNSVPAAALPAIEAYLTAMIDPEERKQVLSRIRKGPVG